MSPQAPARPDSLRSVLGAAVLLALALLGVASVKSHRDLAAARAREGALEASIEATRGRIAGLKARIERLRNDPGTLERLAREDLGLVRPHDLVIELPADGPLPPRPRPQAAPAPVAAGGVPADGAPSASKPTAAAASDPTAAAPASTHPAPPAPPS